MSNLVKILSTIAIIIFEFFMFQFSLEIGAVSLFLVVTTFCIVFVINKITTVVEQPSLVHASDPFRDSSKHAENKNKYDTEKTSGTENLVPGVDSSIFEQFRKKFNLKQTKSYDEDNKEFSADTLNSNSVAKAYEKAISSQEPENFEEELEDVDQVKVTLSENVKILKELQGEKVDGAREETFTEDPEISVSGEVKKKKKLGAGEEALELLTKKHQSLINQNEVKSSESHVEEDDLFANELESLPGGETLIEEGKEESFEEDIFSPPMDNESFEDEEGLAISLRQSTSQGEKFEEAEGLLKLVTTACEAGRMEEAKAGLQSYFKLLKELGQSPSKNVLQLAEKLQIPIEPPSSIVSRAINDELIYDADINSEKITQKENKKTDYSAVMDGIVKTLEKKEAYDEALPLLKDLLKYNRERINISAMDPLFERIEKAHVSMNNNKELVATYKEHLAIKQQLGDMEGELRLLDLISKHYIDSGDQKAAGRYRAESERVRGELSRKLT
ncbi:MAG: hypothetical protein CL935_04745 [Deltaproteobacteria bacterium]|nr:hypothetical protein [Deltaproteobacteria bacterium]|tara:strand:- start:853 stop:2361 length:1509 start_codon:yes stop_codon:yes gene_type:complete